MSDWLESIEALRLLGGYTLPAILVLSTVMWTLIIERYWFLRRVYPAWFGGQVVVWRAHHAGSPRHRERMRAGFAASVARVLEPRLAPIRAIVTALPLLGLLGTVSGMVDAFDLIADTGAGDARVFSSGVSQALVSTVAGLVTALSGLYFSIDLQRRTEHETERAAGLLAGTYPGRGDA